MAVLCVPNETGVFPFHHRKFNSFFYQGLIGETGVKGPPGPHGSKVRISWDIYILLLYHTADRDAL